MPEPSVAIVMGSRSDLEVMQPAADRLAALAVSHSIEIVSAHRTPERMFEFAREAEAHGIAVVIAGAGGAAHLPGMIASLTLVPVIGVPVAATLLNGTDSALSILQMPAGIPVATVAINNAENAALLAAQIMALGNPALRQRLHAHRRTLAAKVADGAAAVNARFDYPEH